MTKFINKLNCPTFILKSYFDENNTLIIQNDFTQIKMKQCDQSDWNQYTNHLFQKSSMQSLRCPVNKSDIKLKGAFQKKETTVLLIYMQICANQKYQCTTNLSDFSTQYSKYGQLNQNYFHLIISDLKINPKSQDSFIHFLNSDPTVYFGYTQQQIIYIQLGIYTVETDHSIWPFLQDIQVKTGYYVQKITKRPYNMNKDQVNKFLISQCLIYLSGNGRRYVRQKGKIDQVFSFAGGLFGILVGLLAVCIFPFNQHRYQLMVAQSSSNYDQHGTKFRQKKYNIFWYLRFQIYRFFKCIFCCFIKKSKGNYQKIQDSLQQANNQLNVVNFFRKIQIMQENLKLLTKQNEQILINLVQPPSITEIKNKRSLMQYYDKIIKGKLAITIQDIRTDNSTLSLYKTKRKITSSKKSINIQESQEVLSHKNIIYTNDNLQDNKLRQDLRNNFGFINNQILLEKIIGFTQIRKQAEEIKTSSQMFQAEKRFAQAMMEINIQDRIKILEEFLQRYYLDQIRQ